MKIQIAVIAAMGLVASASTVSAQDKARSVWDGVYSEAQAKRGEALFRQHCQTCHGESLEGDGEAAPLSGGEPFWNYNGKPLSALFNKINKEMPAKNPGTLSRETTADLLSFLLHFNKFPSGPNELPPGADALNAIRYQSTKPDSKDSKE